MKCIDFNHYNFKTYINLPKEEIEIEEIELFCPNINNKTWESHYKFSKKDKIMQVIERNKANYRLELSYWVRRPICGYEHLLKRIT